MSTPIAPDHGAGRQRRRPPPTYVGALALVALVAAACGSDLLGPASTSTTATPDASTTSTTAPLTGEVAVAFPVVACTTSYGTPLPDQVWKPSILLAPIPTSLVGKVEFYTDGTRSLLAPSGWSCAETTGSDGATDLAVLPSGIAAPPGGSSPPPGTEGVFATFDNTGNSAGVGLVCRFFTLPSFQQQEADCGGPKPQGEQTSMPTPDVASVSDPVGVVGSLAGSGGFHAVSGTVIFPQAMPAVTEGASIEVAVESCSLTDTTLCPTVLSDFEVREFPVPSPNGGFN